MLSLVHSPNFGQARNRPGWPHLGSGKRTNASRCLEIMAGHLTSSLRDPLGGLKSIPRAVETKYHALRGINSGNVLSHSCRNEKSTKYQRGWFLLRAVRKCLFHASVLDLQMGSSCVSSHPLPFCVCVSVFKFPLLMRTSVILD